MTEATALGLEAEKFAAKLLRSRGYSVTAFKTNNPTYDLEVSGSSRFMVSVKASKAKQHVRLGSLNSVRRLERGHFLFAFMPAVGRRNIEFSAGKFRLLIIPAEIARVDSIAVRDSYIESRGLTEAYNYSLMVKGYSRRQHQVKTWEKWNQFENGWPLLPKSQK